MQRAYYKKTGRPWRKNARCKQLPPDEPKHHMEQNGFRCNDPKCLAGDTDNDWRIWLLLTGRGFGKTLSGSNWLVEQALKHPNTKWGVASSTANELESVCFNGDSGIRRQLLPGEEQDFNVNKMRLVLSNGSIIQGFSAEQPDRIRGQNLDGLWWDEAAIARYQSEFWRETARLAVRKGGARIVITTTPKSTKLIRDLVSGKYAKTHVTQGFMWENTSLPADWIDDVKNEYAGTRLGRQELEGVVLEDFEGALFNRADIETYKYTKDQCDEIRADARRIVIGVDPAMKSGENSDDSGIIVAAAMNVEDQEHLFILEDATMKGTPGDVCKKVRSMYLKWHADCVYVEDNQGGDWVANALKAVDASIPVRQAHSSRGKITRAEPVSLLCQAGRLHMVGDLAELVDQLCCMMPNEKPTGHDDRADAMVHAAYGLGLVSAGSYMDVYGMTECPRCEKVHRKIQVRCPSCGFAYPPREKQQKPERTSRDRGFAAAYTNVCSECDKAYNKQHKKCPSCFPAPESYMAQVAQMTGQGGGWLNYANKNWFDRKF